MRRADLLENGMLQWQCRINMDHEQAEEATAVIHVPCSGSASMVVQICEIDCLPCGPDEFGDNAVIREGEDGERWRNVVLIANAPNLLNTCQQAEKKLDAIVQAGMNAGGLSESEPAIWRALEEIRRSLDVAADWATDTGSF